MTLHKITTIVQFAHTYFIEADELEHAEDALTMRESGVDADWFEESKQEYLGETIVSAETIKRKHFDKWLETEAAKGNKSHASHWMGEDLIHTVDYSQPSAGASAFKFMGADLILGTPNVGNDD